MNLGETVKLTITAFNDGPNSADVKVIYNIPFGLKRLSLQGEGAYDSNNGIWNVGRLDENGNATVELVLQAVNNGYFVNTVNVYGDLASVSFNSKRIVSTFSVRSASGTYDPDNGNNQANFNFNSISPSAPGYNGNNYNYEFPRDVQPSDDPKVPHNPPKPPEKPDYGLLYPKNQLERDIAGVRYVLSHDTVKKPFPELIVPEWRDDPESELTQEEYGDWAKTMLKLSVEVLALAAIDFAPTGGSASGEYLQGVKNSFINNFKVLGTITKYFGNSKYVGKISEALKSVKKAINNPTVEKIVNSWNLFLDKWGFNYGMEVFKRGLYKLFPGQESKINALLLGYSSYQFITDPWGTLSAIVDIITSLIKGQLPDRESFEKIFIFDPAQEL